MSQTHAVLSLTTVRRNDCALEELCGADTCAGQLYIFRIQRRTRTRGGDGRKGGMEIEARVASRGEGSALTIAKAAPIQRGKKTKIVGFPITRDLTRT